ncbi:capsular biosynthesis protein [Berryella intestinalis]|uniref:Capsular biosynthesis protein n=1 Tax=Berryella intestinalis TaxID=1531429 RepID=A0A0A8BAU3_9ACTN|nr:DegT/DnrJ/EryC1/StrS aminotransferase family protein [Berryella intestinalis]AJC12292.1 capsular biosynthesis protein [Berryella intestinalis]
MGDQRVIPFSPPDITEAEIDGVVEVLKSGWITTGPKTKEFERRIAALCNAPRAAALSSATAALECALRVLGIGPGDEVITSAYTYTASASCICHVGATPVLCDVAPGSFEMDLEQLASRITDRTKAIIPVDLAGIMADYDGLRALVESSSDGFRAKNDVQEQLGRIALIADGAHSLGAARHGLASGEAADFTAVSFHAVKNLTTAEGGALAWRAGVFDDDEVYRRLMLWSLHGQTKDALAKTKVGAWEYDVAFPGWKCNMNELSAALGLAQAKRYPSLLARRRAIVSRYEANLAECGVELIRHYAEHDGDACAPRILTDEEAAAVRKREAASPDGHASSGHLMIARLTGRSTEFRNRTIEALGELGIAANVHYKPLPLLSAYRDLGFDIAEFPNAYAQFENEITLPLHTLLSDDDVDYVCERLAETLGALERSGVR